jgi:hypothetical protein
MFRKANFLPEAVIIIRSSQLGAEAQRQIDFTNPANLFARRKIRSD